MVNSGDLRGKGGAAVAETTNANTRTMEVSFCIFIVCPAGLPKLPSLPKSPKLRICDPRANYSINKLNNYQISSDCFPFINYALHFCCGRGCGIFRALFALKHPRHHSGDNGSIENLHISRGCNSWNTEIR